MSVGYLETNEKTHSGERRGDWIGIACSLFCLVHCWSLPILLTLAPTISAIKFLANPLFHQLAFAIALVVALIAIVPEVLRTRDKNVIVVLGIGLVLLFVGAFLLPEDCCGSAAIATQVAAADDFVLFAAIQPYVGSEAIATFSEWAISATSLITPLGGLFLVLAHMINLWNRTSRRCC